MKFKNLNDLKHQLDTKFDGVVTLPMWVLRDTYGAARLGRHVVSNIAEELQSRGIGHFPVDLPQDQMENARLYLLNSPAGRILKAALNLDPDQDVALRKITSVKSDDVLKKVRELVCD